MQTFREIEWTPEQIARFWDYQSRRPSATGNYFSISRGAQIAKRTLPHVAKSEFAHILDFGCGTGHFLRHLAHVRPSLQLHGIDFSPDSIRVAQEICASIDPIPDLRVTNEFRTSWPDGSFDAIFSIEVVEHLSDHALDAMITEASRLLKRGGFMVITTPSNEDLESLHTCCPNCNSTFHIWQHVRSWSTESLSQFMSGYGFTKMSAKDTFLEPVHVRLLLWVVRRLGLATTKPPRILAIYRK